MATSASGIGLSKIWHPTEHIIGHIGDRFLRVNDPTNSVKALKKDRFLRLRLQSHQVHPTTLTIIQQLCIMQKQKKRINTNESMHSEMGAVWQNTIQRTVRTAHLSVLWLSTASVHNTTQNSSDNLPSYLQTNIIAQMLSIGFGGEAASGVTTWQHATNVLLLRQLYWARSIVFFLPMCLFAYGCLHTQKWKTTDQKFMWIKSEEGEFI